MAKTDLKTSEYAHPPLQLGSSTALFGHEGTAIIHAHLSKGLERFRCPVVGELSHDWLSRLGPHSLTRHTAATMTFHSRFSAHNPVRGQFGEQVVGPCGVIAVSVFMSDNEVGDRMFVWQDDWVSYISWQMR